MSERDDPLATIERLQRRLARERSARLQAESIAECVTSERWELRQQLEEKLALRTSELEAARRAASANLTERDQRLSAVTHDLRTSLTALFYLADSLSEEEPMSANQIQDLRRLLSDMQTAMDAASRTSSTDAAQAERSEATDMMTRSPRSLSDIVAEHEAGWHQAAARCGKLLILDIATGSGQRYPGTADEVDQLVLDRIRDRSDSETPVIELNLSVDADGLHVR